MRLVQSLALLSALVTGGAVARSSSSVPASAVGQRAEAPSTTPIADGAKFQSEITHPYYPLTKARFTRLESETSRVDRQVLDRLETLGGVECLVLVESEYQNGEIKEISHNFFAQDAQGNVYYFGEDVDEYENGEVVSHGGAWRVGRDRDEPCVFLPAALRVGIGFQPENCPPEIVEWDEVEALDVELAVPAGTYQSVLCIKEADQPGKWKERKYYARNVGLISENRELNLVELRVLGKRQSP